MGGLAFVTASLGLTVGVMVLLTPVVPQEVLPALAVPLWLVVSAGILLLTWAIGALGCRLFPQAPFEARAPLTDEEFGRLFPPELAAVATGVRRLLRDRMGQTDQIDGLLPSDQAGYLLHMDEFDWSEFLVDVGRKYGRDWTTGPELTGTLEQVVFWAAGLGSESRRSRTKRCT